AQVEVLVLKRVHQLVCDHTLLLGHRQPGREIKLLRFRLIETGDLFAQKLNYIIAQTETLAHKPELGQRLLRRLELFGGSVFIKVSYYRLLDFVLGLERALNGLLDAEPAQATDDLEYLFGGIERGGIGFGN